MSTANSHHGYDVLLLINGIPTVQVELKHLAVNPRKAVEQIAAYKADPGNGYGSSLLCFLQIFVVSNRVSTWYLARNIERHFSFYADERFLPVYQRATEDTKSSSTWTSSQSYFLSKCVLGEMIGC